MKSNAVPSKGKAAFELKHRLVQALNKIADRDTYQIGLGELEKVVDTLSPDTVGAFLSCVIDTDADQKSAVRKECVRAIGALARSHGSLLAPHMAKVVTSVARRLRDADSVVRDACVDACGTLSACAREYGDGGAALVALVRPLFESLGEQNRYVQAGAALCLAKVIDESSYFPGPVLPQMLGRVVKILKNPHFMAKPAVIELIRSIVQAEGASTEQALSSALTSIMDSLKSSDWTTRKAASLALSSIAVSSGYLVASFRTSCLRSLERCKFDKVKPVRDAVTHAIQLWKAIPGSGTPEPSEAGSSTKENFFGDHHDARSVYDGGSTETSFRRVDPTPSASVMSGSSITSVKRRSPLSVNKIPQNNASNQQRLQSSDWHVEISVPKQNPMPDLGKKGMLKYATKSAYEIVDEDIKSDYDPMDDKQDCSSLSEVASRSCETKHVTSALEVTEDCDSGQVTELCPRVQECKSIGSTVTDVSSHGTHTCCLNATKELALIRNQLQEMERKQANIFDLLQEFMLNSMENMSVLNSKVHNLENAGDKTVYTVTQSESCYQLPGSKVFKNQSVSSSPRLSNLTPRSSVDANFKPPAISHLKHEKKCPGSGSQSQRSNMQSSRATVTPSESQHSKGQPTSGIVVIDVDKEPNKVERREMVTRSKSWPEFAAIHVVGEPPVAMAGTETAGVATPLLLGLPDEIVVWEILLRLPPNSLLRCRAVCRAWRRATSIRDFLLAHHNCQPTLPILYHGLSHLYIAHFDQHQLAGDQLQPLVQFGDNELTVETSCDGLLLLNDAEGFLAICNPATRQYAPLRQLGCFTFTPLGMYPHSPTGEYRLLMFDQLQTCHVFALGSCQSPWDIGYEFPSFQRDDWLAPKAVLFRGALHWHLDCRDNEINKVLIFDTTAESFRQMPSAFPDGEGVLFEMDGKLAMSRSDACRATTIEIWVLQDYQSEAWALKCRVRLPVEEIKVYYEKLDYQYHWTKVTMSCDGDLLFLVTTGKWLLQVDIDGKLVARFHRGLETSEHRLKQSLVSHAFFQKLEGYVVNSYPLV